MHENKKAINYHLVFGRLQYRYDIFLWLAILGSDLSGRRLRAYGCAGTRLSVHIAPVAAIGQPLFHLRIAEGSP